MRLKRSYLLGMLVLMCCFLLAQTQSKKRGIVYDIPSYQDMNSLTPGVSWYYNWGIQPNSAVRSNFESTKMEYVPMTWNGGYDKTQLRSFLTAHPSVKYILAFNEPNFKSQANMTPSQAAAAWPQLEAIAKEFGLKIISPAPNWCGDCVSEGGTTYYDPVVYLDDFFKACPTCQVDYIGIHYYMGNVDAIKGSMERLRKYGKPIWFTEFNMDKGIGDNGTVDEQRNFMVETLNYLEQEPLIFRYSWFIGRSGTVIDLLKPTAGTLTDNGKIYTNMSSYDNSFYHNLNTIIEAEHYIKMNGISLVPTTDVSGNINVGYIDNGDWIEYNIDVPTNSNYYLQIRTTGDKEGKINVTSNGVSVGNVVIPSTGGWSSWQTVNQMISLPAGKQKIRLNATVGGFDINWITVSSTSTEIENVLSEATKVYPNPAINILKIESPEVIDTIKIYDMTGKEVIKTAWHGDLDIRNLKSGIYMLQIVSGTHTISKTFCKE